MNKSYLQTTMILPLVTFVCIAFSVSVAATQNGWQPGNTEQLMKLPAAFLSRAIEQDFTSSPLASALRDIDIEIGEKSQTLDDLEQAMDAAEADAKLDLEHRYLQEKEAFLKLADRKNGLREDKLAGQITIYEKLLGQQRKAQAQQTSSKQQRALKQQQESARARMDKAAKRVDARLAQSNTRVSSKYEGEYKQNLADIHKLQAAIRDHASQSNRGDDGAAIDREDLLRVLIGDAEAELALIEQEKTIIGYMAQLISLDANTLTNQINIASLDGETVSPVTQRVAAAMHHFVK